MFLFLNVKCLSKPDASFATVKITVALSSIQIFGHSVNSSSTDQLLPTEKSDTDAESLPFHWRYLRVVARQINFIDVTS